MGLTYSRPYTARASVPWYGDLPQGQLDASGKMYMRNRYYDPVTGRFTQEDPIGLAGGSNLYGFGGGDPVNFSDPFGLTRCPPCSSVGVRGAVGGAAGAAAAASALVSATSAPDVVAAGIDQAIDYLKDKLQVKFVTYTRIGPDASVYSGRARGVGDPQSIVNARARLHPSRLDVFGPPRVDVWATGPEGYVAIRGREQQLIDAHGRAQSEGGTSANLIRGVNKMVFPLFDAAATAKFGPLP
jgi:RHS repeat-associated protein